MFPFRLLIKGLWMNDVSAAGVLLYPFPILIDIFLILSYIKQLRLKDTLLFAAGKSQATAVSYFFNWILNPFCDRYLWTVPNSNGFFPFLGKEVFSLLIRLCFGFERNVFVCPLVVEKNKNFKWMSWEGFAISSFCQPHAAWVEL